MLDKMLQKAGQAQEDQAELPAPKHPTVEATPNTLEEKKNKRILEEHCRNGSFHASMISLHVKKGEDYVDKTLALFQKLSQAIMDLNFKELNA